MRKIEFYSKGIFEELFLNRFTYKGKGRPKKSDYVPYPTLLKMYNQKLNEYFNDLILARN